MQEDVYQGDRLNLYAYCRNNPVMYYDPSGYMACPTEQDGGDGGSSTQKPTSQNQMQRQVQAGQAPKGIDRVDPPHTSMQQPHIHFGDNERALNMDGTWHDGGKEIPNITNKIIKWILGNGWKLPKD